MDHRAAARRERGFVIAWMAIVLVLLLSVAAFAVDLVHAYFEAERAQKAADAAALAGAAQIPADTTCAHATTTAHLLAADNKEADGVDRTVVTPRCSGADEMTVDVEHTFDTMFAKIIGIDTLTVRRRAVAQYDPPLQMGSAVNYLGDVPSCPPGTVAFPVCKAQVGSPPARLPSQHMWAQIQGRDTDKSNGNPYTTNVCNTAVPTDGCNGAGADTNLQFDGNGEWFLIQNLTGGPLDVWIYDAQFVNTRPECDEPDNSYSLLPYEQWKLNDPAVAALNTDPAYCTGDLQPAGGEPAETQFEMRGPAPHGLADMSFDDYPAIDDPNCAPASLPGFFTPDDAWDAGYTQYWHQWWHFCSLTGTSRGSLYAVHVTSPSGIGVNQFTILALHGTSAPTTDGDLSVFTRARLPLYANNPVGGQTSRFYVARVLPSPSRDRTLNLEFFDLGDQNDNSPSVTATGTLSIVTQGVSSPSSFDCVFTDPPGSPPEGGPTDPRAPWGGPADIRAASPCRLRWDKATWNGQWVSVQIALKRQGSPGGYDCNTASYQNCWIQVALTPDGSSKLSDATTWNAAMNGAPVRLVG